MLEFILMIVVLIIGVMLFGKTDTKKELLNQVGLDLSEGNYEDKKGKEFRKFSLKAMKAVIDLDSYFAPNENSFISYMSKKLHAAVLGRYVEEFNGNYELRTLNLGVKKNYIQHAETVISRREKDLKEGKNVSLSSSVNFSDKKSAKRYCEILWDKYQYPWPDDWMQKDGYL
jgi:hypothetical protein